jgi:hypothetical protein
MPSFSRKAFIQTVALGGGSVLTAGLGQRALGQTGPETVELKNDNFTLSLQVGEHGLLVCHLVHVPSGTVLADGPYSYTFGPLALSLAGHDGSSATIKGTTTGGLELTHIFRVPAHDPWIEEEITIQNTTKQQVSETFRCGFVLPIQPETLKDHTFTAVPFRTEPRGDAQSYQDFKRDEILYLKRQSSLRDDSNPPRWFENYFSEAWVATDNKTGFVFSKYNPIEREFLILDRIPAPGGLTGLRWGGAGVDVSDCEGLALIPAGATRSFGISRLTAFEGDMTQGFYTFRAERDSRGHGLPAHYDPPVHWNELYDNKLWAIGPVNDPAARAKYYTVDALRLEAAKAQAIGCEALYLDPGWDLCGATKTWDTARLGPLPDFVAMLKHDYGLKLSLHTPLDAWSLPTSYPQECYRMTRDGQREMAPCGASKQYIDETARRLNILAEGGVCFIMFDGTAVLSAPCWDPAHGHPLPMDYRAHVNGINLLARRVHEKHPDIAIEMHDQVDDGSAFRYVPIYFGHGKDATGASQAMGFDEVWGFEFMWLPMVDLCSGHSMVLYYYNLAYSLPLYLHIDLREDNAQAVVFWWTASTVRHLGIGGTSTDSRINDAHFAAMKTYRRLKPFYAAGTFYGISQMVHVHRHPTENAAVINCFCVNTDVTPEITFEPARFGLKPDKDYKFTGAEFVKNGTSYTGKVAVAPIGHTLVEVTEA